MHRYSNVWMIMDLLNDFRFYYLLMIYISLSFEVHIFNLLYYLQLQLQIEAREHGTGFYEFSADHDERAKQQQELKQIRESTVENQKKKLELKNTRDKIIADRVKAAKQRVRAKLGLPPEEEQTQGNQN